MNNLADLLGQNEGGEPASQADIAAVMREFLENDAAIKRHADEAESLKEKNKALESLLLDWFVENGIQSFSLNGKIVYKRIDQCVSVKSGMREAVAAWARKAGFGDKVQGAVPPATLKALVVEWRGEDRDDSQVPPELLEMLSIYDLPRVCIRAK